MFFNSWVIEHQRQSTELRMFQRTWPKAE